MTLGVSLRAGWPAAWSELGLDRFEMFEIVPFTDAGTGDEEAALQVLGGCRGRPVWMHLTTVSVGDTSEHFRDRVAAVLGVLRHETVVGVTLHHAVQHTHGHYLPQPFPIMNAAAYAGSASRNLDFLRRVLPEKRFGIENISCGLRSITGPQYSEVFRTFVKRSGLELLLDLTNLYNTVRNTGGDLATEVAALADLPLCYVHIGGAHAAGDAWLDAHQNAVIGDDVLQALRTLPSGAPVVYEHDFMPNNLEAVRLELDRFHATCRA